jgi:hypothetical protein
MACPYLSRRDRTFYVVPQRCVVRDHRVERMSHLAAPTWLDIDASEVVVLRGLDRNLNAVHTWCVRLCYAINGSPRRDEVDAMPCMSTFLLPMPTAIRQRLVSRLRATGRMQTSSLLTSCMDPEVGGPGRLDPYLSGWVDVHRAPDIPDGVPRDGAPLRHSWAAWMRRQLRHAMAAAQAVDAGTWADGREDESDGDADADADADLDGASASDSEDTEYQYESADDNGEEEGEAAEPARPTKRARVMQEARALQELLEEMEPKVGEGRYLAAANRLKAIVDAAT